MVAYFWLSTPFLKIPLNVPYFTTPCGVFIPMNAFLKSQKLLEIEKNEKAAAGPRNTDHTRPIQNISYDVSGIVILASINAYKSTS